MVQSGKKCPGQAEGGTARCQPGAVEAGAPQQDQGDHGDGDGERVDDGGPGELVGDAGHQR